MKKMYYVFATVVMTLLLSSVVFADPLATLDTKEGTVDIVGYTIDKDDGKDIFVLLLEFTNMSEDSKSPLLEYTATAFQKGVELDPHFSFSYSYEDFKSIDTKVRPGSTLKYYQQFEMADNSPIEVEVTPMLNWDDIHAEYTFDIANGETLDVSSDDKNSGKTDGTDLEAKYNKLLKKYKKLEKKYKKLKSKMG